MQRRYGARRTIGAVLFFLFGLLITGFGAEVASDWRALQRSRDIAAADGGARDITRAITDLGVVRGFTQTYLMRVDPVAAADLAEIAARFRSGRALLDSAGASLQRFRPDLAVRVGPVRDRLLGMWAQAETQLDQPLSGRDAAFARGWFDTYTGNLGDLEKLLVDIRSPGLLQDSHFVFLSDLRIAILRWRLLRTREMGFIGGLVSTGQPGDPARVTVADGLRSRADALFSQIELNAGSIVSPRLDAQLRAVNEALRPLNETYVAARAAWMRGEPAPIAPRDHDRLTLAAIDSINNLLDAISLETQSYAGEVAGHALRNSMTSLAILLAGMLLSLLAWQVLSKAVIGPLENLANAARRISAGQRDARAVLPGDAAATEARDAIVQFNTMLDTIDRVQDSLQKANDDLRLARSGELQLAQALERQRNFAARLVESAPLAIVALDGLGRVLAANPAFEQLVQYRESEIMGSDWFGLFGGEEAAAWRAAFTTRLQEEEDAALGSGRNAIFDRQGRQHLVEWYSRVLRDERGDVESVLAFGIDVSERQRLETQLRQSQRLEAVGQLTGGVAHDFNNLLAVVLGNLELLMEGTSSQPGLHELAQRAFRAGQRGVSLTRSLLVFARKQTLSPEPVDLRELVGEMIDLVRRTTPASIDVRAIHPAELRHCMADPGQLQNALLNLVLNARDAMPDGGILTISTANATLNAAQAAALQLAAGDYVVLSVADTGIGMPPDVVARAFEPFFTTKPEGRGTGLGLSMVYGFATQSGGQVRIDSGPGAGTMVRLYLPCLDAAAAPAPAARSAAPARPGECVLVVDDNADLRLLVASQLRSLGYQVEEAADGADAWRRLRRGGISLLLTDVVLTGVMNGLELASAALAADPRLRVLYMTGYARASLLDAAALPAGMPILRKPFSKDELAAALRTRLDLVLS